MLPREWERVALGEVATLRSGGTPSKGSPSFWGGSIPWFTAKDLKSFYLTDSIDRLTPEGVMAGTRPVPAGSVLVLVRGMTLLKDIPLGVTTKESAFNQDIRAVLPKKGMNGEFLAYAMLVQKAQLQRFVNVSGHGTGRLETDVLSELVIPIPPEAEQEAIVRVLGSWDSHIRRMRNQIVGLDERRLGLAQELLMGRKRFPEFAEPWEAFRLGELFRERKETRRGDLPLLSITNGRGVIPRGDLDRRDSSNPDKTNYKRIAPGDIGYNTMRMWQGVSALSDLEGIVSPAYTICTPKPDIDGRFAAHLFKLPQVVHLFHRYSQGLVDDTLQLRYSNFAKIRVTIPGVREQRHIAAALDAADREIDLLCQERSLLERQKRGLMQRLFTGEKRVKA